jgi:hypothetical protein
MAGRGEKRGVVFTIAEYELSDIDGKLLVATEEE